MVGDLVRQGGLDRITNPLDPHLSPLILSSFFHPLNLHSKFIGGIAVDWFIPGVQSEDSDGREWKSKSKRRALEKSDGMTS